MTQAAAMSQQQMELAQNPTLPQQQQQLPSQQQSFGQQLPDSQALSSDFQQFPQMVQQLPAPRQQFIQQAPMMEQQVGLPYQP